jgi:hypothetical protein
MWRKNLSHVVKVSSWNSLERNDKKCSIKTDIFQEVLKISISIMQVTVTELIFSV